MKSVPFGMLLKIILDDGTMSTWKRVDRGTHGSLEIIESEQESRAGHAFENNAAGNSFPVEFEPRSSSVLL